MTSCRHTDRQLKGRSGIREQGRRRRPQMTRPALLLPEGEQQHSNDLTLPLCRLNSNSGWKQKPSSSTSRSSSTLSTSSSTSLHNHLCVFTLCARSIQTTSNRFVVLLPIHPSIHSRQLNLRPVATSAQGN